MTRQLSALVLAAALAMPLAACRTTHLGKDTAVAFDNARAVQRSNPSKKDGPALSANDAHEVLRTHRGQKSGDATGQAVAGGGLLAAPMLGGGGSGSSGSAGGAEGAYPGSTGNISLQAK